jgi:hypothetical protein
MPSSSLSPHVVLFQLGEARWGAPRLNIGQTMTLVTSIRKRCWPSTQPPTFDVVLRELQELRMSPLPKREQSRSIIVVSACGGAASQDAVAPTVGKCNNHRRPHPWLIHGLHVSGKNVVARCDHAWHVLVHMWLGPHFDDRQHISVLDANDWQEVLM